MRKLIIIIGLLLSFQMLQANEEKTVELKAGYNAVQFDANVTLEYLLDKISFENLISIQGARESSAYKKAYVDEGTSFLNGFKKTEFGEAYWIKVDADVNFSYVPEVYEGTKNIDLRAGWNFVGPIGVLTFSEIQEQVGVNNLLVIQGARQGQTYKKSYVDDGTDFLNSFTAFERGQGYWVKVVSSGTLSFVFELENRAKDNTNHNAETVKTIAGKEYTIRVYTDSTPTSQTSEGTISIHANINSENVAITINGTYPTDSNFQVKVFDRNGEFITHSDIVDYNALAVEFSNITIPNINPCIALEDSQTKDNIECITDMSSLFSYWWWGCYSCN